MPQPRSRPGSATVRSTEEPGIGPGNEGHSTQGTRYCSANKGPIRRPRVVPSVDPSHRPRGHERTSMKRTFAFATLLGALALVAALVSASASAVTSAAPQTPSHIKGVVPVIGKQLPGAGIPLINHGGPVMTTNKTYAIYWVPAGYSIPAGYDTTINQYFTDVAADSGKWTNVYATRHAVLEHPVQLDLRRLVHGQNAFPASGCPLYNGAPQVPDRCPDPDRDRQRDRSHRAGRGTARNMFFLFTPPTSAAASTRAAAAAPTPPTAPTTAPRTLGANLREPALAAAPAATRASTRTVANHADPTINVVSHEHNEAITDRS